MARSTTETWWLAACAVALAALPAAAEEYEVRDGSEVGLTAHITAGTFEARTRELSGRVEYDEAAARVKSAEIALKAGSFRSGVAVRDRHMSEKYLEAGKYPLILFRLGRAGVRLEPGSEAEVDGTFEVRKVKKPARVKLRVVSRDGGRVTVRSQFRLSVTDFGIPRPSYAVVKMEPEVDVTVDLVLERR